MKSPLDRTKVVLRHLPPTITESMLIDQIDIRFVNRYNWLYFRPGKTSQKRQVCARAYINFNRPEDVIEFAELFDGHVFVNEKGTQFKVIVEYAPSQRVPKQWSKKDGREGTILKDPEYLEFLEFLAKPVENLPSAEIQLERREAERSGAAKDTPIVTPLMDFIRQKRAAKSGLRRQIVNGKTTRRTSGASAISPSSSKRRSEKRRTSTMYVPRENSKATSSRDKSTYVEDSQELSDITVVAAASGVDLTGGSGPSEMGNKKILLLKGKEKEMPNITLTGKNSPNSNAKQNERREPSGRIIRSILLNKDHRKNSPSSAVQSEQQLQIDKDKRPPRAPKDLYRPSEDSIVGTDAHHIDRQEKRTRNRDRPDRGVWAPLRRSDGSHASDESFSSSGSQPNLAPEYVEETRDEFPNGRSGEFKFLGSGHNNHSSMDNGSYKNSGRRGSVHNLKEAEDSVADNKPLKRGGSSGYGSNEKQVWIQKSSSGS
ncbi:hypothetical protein Leryth_007244 [Lithospermum erythrorhizon]|nr:hypothetical protein Leryth_007244 [Lithospermum erythrorhizon]